MSGPCHVVFYGSLREGLHLGGEPPFWPLVRFVGPCRLPGRLYEVGDGSYPGLELGPADGDDVVHGELYEVLDDAALELLDAWEEYDPADQGSPYVRVATRLRQPPIEAWVYVGRHRRRGPWVRGGDWRRHRR
jgi:gamma-glutamylcyclotransferase (GGCT)/AIG2-like uncharacterized protein YtfP